ncbi:hypothetical protein MMB19_04515 [Ralstonia insidiosa]|nr:hypothetical protein MMB19_04515 [Ralstonia insidiosa]
MHADALVHVAVSLANARLWPWRGLLSRPQLAWLLNVRIPLAVARVQGGRGGMLPLSDVGMGPMAIPATILGDWARFARQRGYLFAPGTGLDTSRYPRLAVPLLAWGFDDDPMAPARAINALVAQFPAASVTRRQVGGAALPAKGVGHMGFFAHRPVRHGGVKPWRGWTRCAPAPEVRRT